MTTSDKVICIDDSNIDPKGVGIFPNGPVIKGETYCIQSVSDNGKGVEVVGKPAIYIKSNKRAYWLMKRFATIQSLREAKRQQKKLVGLISTEEDQ